MAKNFFDQFDAAPTASPLDAALAAEGVKGPLADLARSIYTQESGGGKNTKTSNAGAVGGMQILPGTFQGVADKDWNINDPTQNARAGIRYLKQGYEAAGGDPALAGAFYYGGPSGLEKARRGVAVSDPRNPSAPNTLQYGAQVAARLPKEKGLIQRGVEAVIPSANAAEPNFFDQFDAPAASATPANGGAQGSWGPEQGSSNVLGRQLGLTLRAGTKGVLGLPGMVSDAATGVVNAGLDAYHDARAPELGELVTGKQKGFRFKTVNAALDNIMTGVGVAQPQNATERVVQDLTSAMSGTGGSVAAGKFLANSAAPVVAKVGEMVAAGPGMQTAAAALGSGAGGVVRENGGGAGAQTAANLAGAFLPSMTVAGGSAALRGLVRGGEEGRQTVNRNVKLFQDAAGTVPSVGQATEKGFPRAVESLLAKTPGSGGLMQRSAQAKSDAMAKSVTDTAEGLAPGGSAVKAGEAIESGVQSFKEGIKDIQTRLYETLDKHIKPGTPLDVSNTRKALAALNEGIPGAPNISEFFKNAKIKGIESALLADLDEALKAAAPVGSRSSLMNAAKPNVDEARLPYEAIKKLRTLVGKEIADNALMADVPRSKWTALYAALSEDLGTAAKQAGPEAEQSWRWANQFTNSQIGRLEDLSKIVGKDSPEKIFNAAMAGTKDGDTIIRRVVDAIPKENRKEIAAAVLKRMGQATAGNQNAVGDAFSSETFLTNVNKLSPEARNTLFGRLGVPGIPEKLNKLAEMSGNIRNGSKVFANPSGTAQALSLRDLGIGSAAALLTGNPLVAAGGFGAAGGANLLAKKMTDPKFVKWLGEETTISPALAPSAMNSLARWGER
jgi:hypothetical protein